MRRFWGSFWLVENWNGAFWLGVRLLPLGALRYKALLSNEEILGLILIGREQFHHQGALRVNCVDGSDWSRAVTWPMTSQLICMNLHKLHSFVVKPSPEGATCRPILSPLRHCFAVILSGCATGQVCRRFWLVESRHVTYDVTVPHLHITWPLYGGCHLVLLPCCFAMIRSPGGAATTSLFLICISRDLSMEAAILFCCHFVLRWYDYQTALRVQGRRSNVTDLLHLYNCQLGLGLVILILSSVVNPNANPVGLVTLIKGQRSPTFCTDTIASLG